MSFRLRHFQNMVFERISRLFWRWKSVTTYFCCQSQNKTKSFGAKLGLWRMSCNPGTENFACLRTSLDESETRRKYYLSFLYSKTCLSMSHKNVLLIHRRIFARLSTRWCLIICMSSLLTFKELIILNC